MDAFQQALPVMECDGGALLSFVPTWSEGMSPALRNTVEKVYRTFADAPQERQLSLWH
jgi:hypothetical protein